MMVILYLGDPEHGERLEQALSRSRLPVRLEMVPSARELLNSLSNGQGPDAVLLDLAWLDEDERTAPERVQQSYPTLPLLFVSSHDTPQEVYSRLEHLAHLHHADQPRFGAVLDWARDVGDSQLLQVRRIDTGEADVERLSDLFDAPTSLLREAPGGPEIFARTAELLLPLVGSPAALRWWMHTPVRDLGNQPPIELIKAGDGQIVVELLEDTHVGQPG